MALASGTIFQTQASATTGNVNGAGFNPGSANFFTDLATDANTANTASPVVSSASYNFVAGDVNNYVYVKSGTHWQAGWYPIASVASNKATLNAAIGAVILPIGATGIVTLNTTVGCTSDNTATLSSGTYGVDYSQSDTATASSSTATSSGAGSIILFAGSAASMIGNLVQVISGTNFTAGWYEITGESVGVSVTTDRAVTTGIGANGVINIGGAGRLNGAEDAFQAMLPAASIVWVKNGSYTLSGAISTASTNSTATNPSFFIGFNTTRGDTCNGANRPVIAAAANAVTWSQDQMFKNISFTTTAANGIGFRAGSIPYNCKVLNSSTTAARLGFQINNANGDIINNEAISQNGKAITVATNNPIALIGNYVHDSDKGIDITGNSQYSIIENIFEGCTTWAYGNSASGGNYIINNTLYGREAKMGIGVNLSLSNSPNNRLINNIVYGLATGVSVATAAQGTNFGQNNDFFNNTADVSNWTKDTTDIALDPTFAGASQVTGTTGSGSGSVLTDTNANFNGNITDNVDFLHQVSGTGATVGCYLITSHTNTTLTVNNAVGTNATADRVYWIGHGHNFAIGTNLKAQGFPSFANVGSGTTSYQDIGGVQRQEAGGGGTPILQSGIIQGLGAI